MGLRTNQMGTSKTAPTCPTRLWKLPPSNTADLMKDCWPESSNATSQEQCLYCSIKAEKCLFRTLPAKSKVCLLSRQSLPKSACLRLHKLPKLSSAREQLPQRLEKQTM